MLITARMLKPKIIDTLTSNSSEDILSANMGNILNTIKLDTIMKSYELIVDGENGIEDDLADGTELKPFLTISAAYNSLPDFANNVVIKVKSGTYAETNLECYKNIVNLTIESFSGENDVTIQNKNLNFKITNGNYVEINNIIFDLNSNVKLTPCLTIENTHFLINSCYFKDGYNGVVISRSIGTMSDCNFTNITNANITLTDGSNVVSDNNTSIDNCGYGAIINGSALYLHGDMLNGTISDTLIIKNGQVFATTESIETTDQQNLLSGANMDNPEELETIIDSNTPVLQSANLDDQSEDTPSLDDYMSYDAGSLD